MNKLEDALFATNQPVPVSWIEAQEFIEEHKLLLEALSPQSRDDKKQKRLLREQLKINPKEYIAWVALFDNEFGSSPKEKDIPLINEALEEFPNSPQFLEQKTAAYIHDEFFDEAKKVFWKRLALPNAGEELGYPASEYIVNIALESWNYTSEESIEREFDIPAKKQGEMLEKTIKDTPKSFHFSSAYWEMLWDAYIRQDNDILALEAIRAHNKNDPNNPYLLDREVRLLHSIGNYEEAIENIFQGEQFLGKDIGGSCRGLVEVYKKYKEHIPNSVYDINNFVVDRTEIEPYNANCEATLIHIWLDYNLNEEERVRNHWEELQRIQEKMGFTPSSFDESDVKTRAVENSEELLEGLEELLLQGMEKDPGNQSILIAAEEYYNYRKEQAPSNKKVEFEKKEQWVRELLENTQEDISFLDNKAVTRSTLLEQRLLKAIKADENNYKATYDLMRFYETNNKHEQAMKYLLQLRKIIPEDIDYDAWQYTDVIEKLGDEKYLPLLFEMSPSITSAWYDAGKLYTNANNKEMAIRAYVTAIKHVEPENDYTFYYSNLAELVYPEREEDRIAREKRAAESAKFWQSLGENND